MPSRTLSMHTALILAALSLCSLIVYGTLKLLQIHMFQEFIMGLIDRGVDVDIGRSYHNLSRSVAWNFKFGNLVCILK